MGISISSYCDIEAHDAEWLDIPIGELRSLSQLLQFDVFGVIDPGVSLQRTSPEHRSAPIIVRLWPAASDSFVMHQIRNVYSNRFTNDEVLRFNGNGCTLVFFNSDG